MGKMSELITRNITDEITLEDIANDAGIDPSTVGKIASGEIECPPIEVLQGIGDALDLQTGTLQSAAEEDGCNYDSEAKRVFTQKMIHVKNLKRKVIR